MGKRKKPSTDGPLGAYAPRFWLSWLIVGLSWLLAKTPARAQSPIARGLAKLCANTGLLRSQIIRRNIERCFPELEAREKDALVEENLYSTVLCLFDLLVMVWGQREDILRRGEIIGEQYLRDALARDEPLILVSGHSTPFLLGLAKLTEITPFAAVYRRMDNPVLEAQLYQRAAKNYPIETIHRKEIPRMLNRLADTSMVAILPDQDFGVNRGTFIDFFGIKTATITAIPQYARSANARVILGITHRKPNGGYALELKPALENYPSGDDVADTVTWSNWLEGFIREHPADYFWIHKRFKTRPPGEGKFY